MVCLLFLAVAADAEDWNGLWKEWKAALARHEAALRQAPNDEVRARIRHPIAKFRPRLRTFAIDNAGHPIAAPALIELLRHTRDAPEQLWVMLQLRENHLRSKYLGRTVDALVRIDTAESLRTLREIAQGSPHEAVARRARRGVHECTVLAVGNPAPWKKLRAYRGKPLLLLFGQVATDLRGVGITTVTVTDAEVASRFNAAETARLFLIDKQGRIAGKDLARRELDARITKLK
jgi:hypothetical protein